VAKAGRSWLPHLVGADGSTTFCRPLFEPSAMVGPIVADGPEGCSGGGPSDFKTPDGMNPIATGSARRMCCLEQGPYNAHRASMWAG